MFFCYVGYCVFISVFGEDIERYEGLLFIFRKFEIVWGERIRNRKWL